MACGAQRHEAAGSRALHGSGQIDSSAAQLQRVNYMDRQTSPGPEAQRVAHHDVYNDSEEYHEHHNMSTTTQFSHGYHDSTDAHTANITSQLSHVNRQGNQAQSAPGALPNNRPRWERGT